jgi:glyoxylase-like metal-dependent hydrolase (beta-lactamase superfamily II)
MSFTYPFEIGNFKAISIADQRKKRSMEFLFQGHPVEEVQNFLKENNLPDEVQSDGNVLYINTGEHHVLVDSGIGFGDLIAGLNSKGISPDKIDYVIITHGDGDHILGLIDKDGKSTFPNARIVMWEKAWELWTTEDGLVQMVEDFEIVMRNWNSSEAEIDEMKIDRRKFGTEMLVKLQSQLTLVNIDEEFIPGFRLIDARGHRRDMVGVEISSDDNTLIHVSDSLRNEIQAKFPHYTCYIDTYPEMMHSINLNFFNLSVEKNAMLFCTHLGFPALAKITKTENEWHWENIPE